jgi:hypothetical protein
MFKIISFIFINSLPILLMIGLIPIVRDDFILTSIYVFITVTSLLLKRYKNDIVTYIVGFCFMIVSEYIFISTGVETFQRNSLLGIMPLWLPFLWGYGFIVIKRSVLKLEEI